VLIPISVFTLERVDKDRGLEQNPNLVDAIKKRITRSDHGNRNNNSLKIPHYDKLYN